MRPVFTWFRSVRTMASWPTISEKVLGRQTRYRAWYNVVSSILKAGICTATGKKVRNPLWLSRKGVWGKPLFGLQRVVSTRTHPSYLSASIRRLSTSGAATE